MVILYVRDAMASLAFYRDVLGMKVLEASPHWVELDAGGIHLSLHPHPNMPAKREDTLPWVVFPVDDVRATHATMHARGVSFLCPPKEVCGDETSVGLSADLVDPDGNRLSIFGMVPRG
jgi:catechol 2,3-dioxygenase-like lactoylglutathione lyase family enzyme